MIDTARVLRVAERLTARKQTIAVSESSAGGLISAALLQVPGASAFFIGAAVIYTGKAREELLGLTPEMLGSVRSATEEMSGLLARTIRRKLDTVWGLAETGAAGPSGNRYGDAAGHCCLALSGPTELSRTMETGSADRGANMTAFANAAFALLEDVLG